jgi:hypothetical protein
LKARRPAIFLSPFAPLREIDFRAKAQSRERELGGRARPNRNLQFRLKLARRELIFKPDGATLSFLIKQ